MLSTARNSRRLLASRDFSLLLAAQWLAQAADGAAQAAFADALVLEPLGRGAPERVLALAALTLVPYSCISPFLGVFVDRWPRRGLMVATNAIRAVILVAAPLWTRLLPQRLGLYLAALILLGLGRLFLTTKGAVLPYVLHEHHLLRGNALSGAGGMIAALSGGVMGLAIVAALGSTVSLVAAGIVYGIASVLARALSSTMAHPHPPMRDVWDALRGVGRELREGLVAVWTRRRARLALAGIFVLRTIGMFVAIAAVLVIRRTYPEAGDRFGRLSASALALGAAGVGAFVGAATTPFVGRRLNKPGLVLLGFGVSSVGLLALGPLVSLPGTLGLTFIGGYGAFLAKISVDAQVQEELPDAYRGRAFSLYDILYNLGTVVAAIVMVVAVGQSLNVLLFGAGALTLVVAAVLGAYMRNAGMLQLAPAD